MFIFSVIFSVISGLILKIVASILKFEENSFKACFFAMFVSTFIIYGLLMSGLINNQIISFGVKLVVLWGILSITLKAPKIKGLVVAVIFSFLFSFSSSVGVSSHSTNTTIQEQNL
jgi:hypothetical protein